MWRLPALRGTTPRSPSPQPSRALLAATIGSSKFHTISGCTVRKRASTSTNQCLVVRLVAACQRSASDPWALVRCSACWASHWLAQLRHLCSSRSIVANSLATAARLPKQPLLSASVVCSAPPASPVATRQLFPWQRLIPPQVISELDDLIFGSPLRTCLRVDLETMGSLSQTTHRL
jgi:hypothetical protein